MKEALQSTLILVVWIIFWLGGTFGGAVLQARLIDIGVVSDIDPPWIITIGSSFIGFFAGAYAAVKLGNLTLRKKVRGGGGKRTREYLTEAEIERLMAAARKGSRYGHRDARLAGLRAVRTAMVPGRVEHGPPARP